MIIFVFSRFLQILSESSSEFAIDYWKFQHTSNASQIATLWNTYYCYLSITTLYTCIMFGRYSHITLRFDEIFNDRCIWVCTVEYATERIFKNYKILVAYFYGPPCIYDRLTTKCLLPPCYTCLQWLKCKIGGPETLRGLGAPITRLGPLLQDWGPLNLTKALKHSMNAKWRKRMTIPIVVIFCKKNKQINLNTHL